MNAIHYLTRLTRRISLVEQELIILPEYLTSSPVFSGVVLIDLLFFVQRFVDRFLSFYAYSYCPYADDLWTLTTTLVSSHFS